MIGLTHFSSYDVEKDWVRRAWSGGDGVWDSRDGEGRGRSRSQYWSRRILLGKGKMRRGKTGPRV